MTRTEYSWLLPSAMVADPELYDPEPAGGRPVRTTARGRPRRTVRDWLVDLAAFLFAVLMALVVIDQSAEINGAGAGVVHFDEAAGLVACCSVWLRRRRPVHLAVALCLLSVFSPAAAGALLVALFSLAVHRPFRTVAVVGAMGLVLGLVQPLVRPDPTTTLLASIIGGIVVVLLVTGWGMLVRSQRQLYVALRERARRAETEAELRAQQAQRLAREAIAREMHDVLAHRLTLLSVHAGALEFRPDAPPAEVARAAGVIRDSAHDALQDLRQIIGVLRAPGDGEPGDRPQPTLATLDTLVAESRDAGMAVRLDNGIEEPARVPAALGRTVYRIAQEGLTNARKHAPGAEVTLAVTGAPGDGVVVSVDNPAPGRTVTPVPGSGQGLIGLSERATLAGGSLEHGKTGDGGFHVRAWLPWAA
ncbi:sensor histidine kinase [Streptomyces sp. NPDC058953]|uniref:sensor histidine kinase n=1 Tax=unclassified Streptomyces TaxID=2593676 RepID=UPI0036CA2C4F